MIQVADMLKLIARVDRKRKHAYWRDRHWSFQLGGLGWAKRERIHQGLSNRPAQERKEGAELLYCLGQPSV
jgi:hypothetical protein